MLDELVQEEDGHMKSDELLAQEMEDDENAPDMDPEAQMDDGEGQEDIE